MFTAYEENGQWWVDEDYDDADIEDSQTHGPFESEDAANEFIEDYVNSSCEG